MRPFRIGIVLAMGSAIAGAQCGTGDPTPGVTPQPPVAPMPSVSATAPELPRRPALASGHFSKLPLGAVKPRGWLRGALEVQASGLTGHLDEFWEPIKTSGWKGDGQSNIARDYDTQYVPNYLEGLVPLAYLLGDQRLLEKAQRFLGFILTRPTLEAISVDSLSWLYIGRMLRELHEVTGDPRVLTLLREAISNIAANGIRAVPGNPWPSQRIGELTAFSSWLYEKTGDEGVLSDTEKIVDARVASWTKAFGTTPYPTDLALGFSHGVDVAQGLKWPALYSLQKPSPDLLSSVSTALANLDREHGQPGGRFNADEYLSGPRPTQGTELCTVVEHMHSLEHVVAVTGDLALADRLESLAFNAKPGALTADMWARQYDQQANQVLVSVASRPWRKDNDSTSNLYALNPNFPCCLPNFGQGWPRFVEHLWMVTPTKELVAMAYGPSEVEIHLADGTTLGVVEQTDYPFDETVRLEVRASAPANTTIHVRIPGWATGATVVVDGETRAAAPGTLVSLRRVWRDGDPIELHFPMKIRVENRFNDAVSILRGPLVFALRIGMDWKMLKQNYLGSADWEIRATSPWNYGLVLDRNEPAATIAVVKNPIGRLPFGQRGDMVYDAGSGTFVRWSDDPPIVLKAKGRRIPEWGMDGANAADPPRSPVASTSPVEDLELVPYGAARLRVTEIPVVAP